MTPLIQTILFRVGGLPKESIDSSKVSFWLFGWDKMTPRVKMTPWRGQNDFIEKELKWLLWFKTTLFRVGGLPKELVDSSKVSFWLLGGVEMTPRVKMTPWRGQNDFIEKELKWLLWFKTTLFRVGGLPKELVDSSKVSFWLLGGVEMTPKVKMTPWRSQNDFLLKESKWLYGVKTTPFILLYRVWRVSQF